MPRSIRLLSAAVAACLLLAVAGCSAGAGKAAASKTGSSSSSAGSSAATAAGDLRIVSPEKVAAKYLTAADVERVAGITGVRVVAKDPRKGAGGDLNFADGKGLVLLLNVGSAKWFTNMKTSNNYREPVSGLGDEAFDGPSTEIMATLYQLGFRKADNAALLTAFLDPGDPPKARLSQDQLKQLAAIAISRF
jgi:hypothetical protein